MTRKEKFIAIKERLPEVGELTTELHFSVMVIIGYLSELNQLGIIDAQMETTASGENFKSILTEFEWVPLDEEIEAFTAEMLEYHNREAFKKMLIAYRDNKDEYIKTLLDAKKSQESN